MNINLKGKRFLVLGRAGMDFYADPPGTKLEQASYFAAALGGSAANIAVAIARIGGTSSLISAVSDDAVGRYILNQLKHYKVAIDHVKVASGEVRSSLAVVEQRNDNCQNVIYRNGAADFNLSQDTINEIPFKHFDALIITGTALACEPSRTATLRALDVAKSAGLSVIFDIDFRPYSWQSTGEAAKLGLEAAALSNLIVGNDVEFDVLAEGVDGKDLARRMAKEQGKTVIYKMGEKGSVTFVGNTEFDTPIFPVKALKPTGAGDSFMGGLVMAIASGMTLAQSVKRATAAAAIVVTRLGCAPAMPTELEINEFLVSHAHSTL